MRVWVAVVFVVAVLVAGCERAVAPPPVPIQLSEPRFVKLNGPRQPFGSPCDIGGASECGSSICLKVSAVSRLKGHVCSQRCGETPCPGRARCVQVFPGGNSDFCIPEASP